MKVSQKKMAVSDIKITFEDEGGSINWVDDLEEEIPPWEKVGEEIPPWDDHAYWSRCKVEQLKPVKRAARVKKVEKTKKAVKAKKVVTIKKETTFPYQMPLGRYLAMQLGEEGMRKLRKEEGVRTETQLEERYMRQVMREPGPCKNPGEGFQTFDVTKLGEGAVQRLIREWESGPQIVTVTDGGKAQVFVKMLAMSPSSPHIITPFTIKEQPKQDTGEGQLKGVEKKVNIH